MDVLIGDIGNTITKICLLNIKKFKTKKIIYINKKEINYCENFIINCIQQTNKTSFFML